MVTLSPYSMSLHDIGLKKHIDTKVHVAEVICA
jgi:hypothetical protein